MNIEKKYQVLLIILKYSVRYLFLQKGMKVQKISTDKLIDMSSSKRPKSFSELIWQSHIKKVLQIAIDSAKTRKWVLWHVLLSWPSWYWKTTIANIISKKLNKNIKSITWYAITKPADLISILNTLEEWDVLFIDEIHRLRPNIEEVLYIAMEDFMIDMVMPDWWNVKIPISNFTLVWATTQPDKLTKPLKNRFVYNFHLVPYSDLEKKLILKHYLWLNLIDFDEDLLDKIILKIDNVPREIFNFCIKIRDFLTINSKKLDLTEKQRVDFVDFIQIKDWWLTFLHQKYIEILENENRPMWLRSIALQLWINEKTVEEDIEPLLLKLWKIDKTLRWRVLI